MTDLLILVSVLAISFFCAAVWLMATSDPDEGNRFTKGVYLCPFCLGHSIYCIGLDNLHKCSECSREFHIALVVNIPYNLR